MVMEVKIRKLEAKDIHRVREICIETGPRMAGRFRYVAICICEVYLEYYIHEEAKHCFVAVDNDDNAIGYILCASNFERWKQIFKSQYMYKSPHLLTHFLGKASISELERYRFLYPAHLHIDISPLYQGMGIGTRLMKSLLKMLHEENVKGVMLCTSSDNENAINFYRYCGFNEICNEKKCTIMGIKL